MSATRTWLAPAKCWCLLVLIFLPEAWSQLDRLFVPPGLSGAAPARLIFRPQGFAEAWRDPNIRTVVLQNRIVLEEPFWRGQFASTGGVAVMGPKLKLGNFTIGADPCVAVNCSVQDAAALHDAATAQRAELNVSNMPNLMLVESGGLLLMRNIVFAEIATGQQYTYTPNQPYRNIGVGTGLWPTIGLAPNATMLITNATVVYRNPSALDTCQQYTQRTVFNLMQAYGDLNATMVNATAAELLGPLDISIQVQNGSTNETLGQARARYTNVTFVCLPRVTPQQGGLPASMLAVAIAVPIAVVALLAAFAAWFFVRRRRKMCSAAKVAAGSGVSKDIESGQAVWQSDAGARRDQMHPEDDRDRVQPLPVVAGYAALPPQAGSQTNSVHGSGTSAAHSSSTTPAMTGAACIAMPGMYPGVSTIATAVPAGYAGSAPASSSSVSDIRTPAAPGSLAHSNWTSQDNSTGVPAVGGITYRTSSASCPPVINTMGSIGNVDAVWFNQSGGPASGAASSDRGGAMQAYNAGSSGAAGSTGAGSATGRGSGGTATGSGGGESSGMGSGGAVDKRAAMPALLRARNEMAVLRDLKIGPLLGRGSYGRVYKGRWKAVTVAVKIIEHNERTPGTASSNGKRINIGRESLLASSISHPNVVQTYHISTMTVSQRNALAAGMLTEEGTVQQQQQPSQGEKSDNHAVDESADHSGSTHSGSEEQQRDPLETWMLMEYCEKGSLERAVGRGKFIRREDSQPEMIGIYKALLDTASGLDYLHTIGVVHGDLKTANVLLKGSARDVRGFSCKITDFGLSRVLDMEATHISTKTYGTIVYMPSELLLTGRMTTATDIYSFGLMMWELITSTRAFEEELSIGQIFYMIAYQNWRPVVPPNCPPGYAQLMTACWNQDPDARPNIQQIMRTLQKLYTEEKRRLAAQKQAAVAASADRASAEDAQLAPSAPAAAFDSPVLQVGSPVEQQIGAVQQPTEGVLDSAAVTAAGMARASASRAHTSSGTHGSAARSSGGGGGGQSSGSNAVGSGGDTQSSGSVVRGSKGREDFQDWAVAVSQGSMQPRGSHTEKATGMSGATSKGTDTTVFRSLASPSARDMLQQQQQQQQYQGHQSGQQGQLGTVFQQAFAPPTPPTPPAAPDDVGAAGGVLPYSTAMYSDTEIEPVLDSEAVLSGGSLGQHYSTTSNAITQDRDTEDGMFDDASGFLDNNTTRRLPHTLMPNKQQQQQYGMPAVAAGAPSAAAQGFVEALASTAVQPGVQIDRDLAAANIGQGDVSGRTLVQGNVVQQQYMQAQQQQQQWHGAGIRSDAPGSFNSALHEWSSVSTGSMPPVMAGSSLSSSLAHTSSYSPMAGRVSSRMLGPFEQFSDTGRPGSSSSSQRRSFAGVDTAAAQGSASGAVQNVRSSTAAAGGGADFGGSGNSGLFKRIMGGWRRPSPPPGAAGDMNTGAGDLNNSTAAGPHACSPFEQQQTADVSEAPGSDGAAAAAAAGAGGFAAAAAGPSAFMPGADMAPIPAAAAAAASYSGTSASCGMLQTVMEVPSPDSSFASQPAPAVASPKAQAEGAGSQQQQHGGGGGAPSPFAAMAQRAGSLFGPV